MRLYPRHLMIPKRCDSRLTGEGIGVSLAPGQRLIMLDRDLTASGHWDEAMELEDEDMSMVARQNGSPAPYVLAIEADKARFGGGPC